MARRPRILIGEGVKVTVDLTSVSANAVSAQTISVPGATTSKAVIASPGALFIASGLVLLNAYAIAADSVKVVVQNTTGSAIDLAAEQWLVLVIK